jgi:hypothetical protein
VNDNGDSSRILTVAKIVVFDMAGPLALYLLLRSQGWSTVTSLVVSGVLPAVGVILGIVRKRRIGAVCLGSIWTSRPLMYRFAVEFMGADTPRGRDFAGNWRYPGFRHAFKVTTVVWGVAYLLEAGGRVVIVESTSTGTALGISKVMPYVIAGVLAAWNVAYGRQARRKGERLGAEAAARGEVPPPAPA